MYSKSKRSLILTMLVLVLIPISASGDFLDGFEQLGSWEHGTVTGMVSNGRLLAFSDGRFLRIVLPGASLYSFEPVEVRLPALTSDIAFSGDSLFVAFRAGGFQIYDLSTPTQPELVEQWVDLVEIRKLVIRDHLVFMANSNEGFSIVRLDPQGSPEKLHSETTYGWASDIDLYGHYLYVSDNSGSLRIYDISDPEQPQFLGYWGSLTWTDTSGDDWQWFIGTQISSTNIVDDRAYLRDGERVYIVDLSDPSDPTEICDSIWFEDSRLLGVQGTLALFKRFNYQGPMLVDLADPTDPVILSEVAEGRVSICAMTEDRVFTSDYTTVSCYDISDPTRMELIGHPYRGFGSTLATRVVGPWLLTDHGDDTFSLFDRTEIHEPTPVQNLTGSGRVYDAIFHRERICLATSDRELRVLDQAPHLESDPAQILPLPFEANELIPFGDLLAVKPPYRESGLDPDLCLFDIDSSGRVELVAELTLPCVTGSGYYSKWSIFFRDHVGYVINSGENTLHVLDFSIPTQPELVSTLELSREVSIGGHTRGYLYLNCYGDDNATLVVDLNDPPAPVEVNEVAGMLFSRVKFDGDFMYLKSGSMGVVRYDISDPESPAYSGRYNSTTDWFYDFAVADGIFYAGMINSGIRVLRSGGIHKGVPTGNRDMAIESGSSLSIAPNPFNPRTVISFQVETAAPVNLSVFDVRGRRVATLQDGPLPAGEHRLTWDGRNRRGKRLPSGIYCARLVKSDGVHVTKLTLLK